jgi:WD40 repeat protein
VQLSRYDAFISYSHQRDHRLAEALQIELQSFARAWHRPRALRVFRDATDLRAAPGLWPTIEQALERSDWFVLMASPASAGSAWVRREVAWWAAHRPMSRFLIALTDGDIKWADDDFDWTITDAVPRSLSGRFTDEPLWIDLRRYRPPAATSAPVRLGNVVADFAAPIHGRDKDTMVGDHLMLQSRIRRAVRSVIAGLSALVLIAVAAAVIAVQQRNTAEDRRREAVAQTRIALSRQLVVQAEASLESDPRAALRFGIAAAAIEPGATSHAALAHAVARTRYAGTLSGHPEGVVSASFSGNGDLLATADPRAPDGGPGDLTVRLWDLSDRGRPSLAAALPAGEQVWSVALSPDGRTLAVAHPPGGVQFWDVTRPAAPIRRGEPIRGPLGKVEFLAFTPDGSALGAGGFDDGTVRIWDVRSRRPLSRLTQDGGFRSLAFSPDGRLLATGIYGGAARLWNVADPAHPRPLGGPLAFAGDDHIVEAVAFSPDGRTLATGSIEAGGYDGTLVLWDLSEPARPKRLSDPLPGTGAVESAMFVPDGRTLVTGSALNGGSGFRTRLWNVTNRSRPAAAGGPLSHRYGGHLLALHPDGNTVVLGDDTGDVVLWNLTDRITPALLATGSHDDVVWSAQFDRASRYAVAVSDDHTAQVWQTGGSSPPSPIARLDVPDGGLRALALSPDGLTMAIGGYDTHEGMVGLWDMTNPARPDPLGSPLWDFGNQVVDLAFSPDGRSLATASWDGTVRLLDITDRARPAMTSQPLPLSTDAPPENARSVAFSPSGTMLAASSDETVYLWAVTDRFRPTLLGRPLTLTAQVNKVSFSPDGRTLAAAAADNTIQLWDLTDPGKPAILGSPLLHNAEAQDAAFSADGKLLASVSFDGAVRLWDLTDRTRPESLGPALRAGHSGGSVAFSADGTLLATAGGNETRFWELRGLRTLLADPVAAACGLVGSGLSPSQWARHITGVPHRDTCPR